MEVEFLYLSSPFPSPQAIALTSPFDVERELNSISGGVVASLLTLEEDA